MASTSEPIERILVRAAKSPSKKNDGSWTFLEAFLDLEGVDISQRSQSKWMEQFQIYRELTEATKIEESRNPKGQCSPPEWEKKSDAGSFVDSAIDTDDKEVANYICVLVKKTPECPSGLEAALVLYSEAEEESYILQTICDRWGLLPGLDGKVNVKYHLKDSMKSAIEKCNIRLDKDGVADLVFAKKRTDANEEAKDTEVNADQTSKNRGRRSSSQRKRLEELPEEDEEQLQEDEDDDSNEIDAVSNAIGKAFEAANVRELCDEDHEKLGRGIKRAIHGAMKKTRNPRVEKERNT